MAEQPAGEPRSEPDFSVREAHDLLASIRPSAALALLRKPEFASLAGSAFIGFRMDNVSFNNPLVRRRLAHEAARNADFVRELREMEQNNRRRSSTAKQAAGQENVPSGATPRSRDGSATELTTGEDSAANGLFVAERVRLRGERDRLRAERGQLKSESNKAQERIREVEAELAQARAEAHASVLAASAAVAELNRLRSALERERRRIRRLEAENAALRRPPPDLGPHMATGGPVESKELPRGGSAQSVAQARESFVTAV